MLDSPKPKAPTDVMLYKRVENTACFEQFFLSPIAPKTPVLQTRKNKSLFGNV